MNNEHIKLLDAIFIFLPYSLETALSLIIYQYTPDEFLHVDTEDEKQRLSSQG